MSEQFKIRDVRIINSTGTGKDYWERVKEHPNEPLIEAVMVLTLSHTEYHKLLRLDRTDD